MREYSARLISEGRASEKESLLVFCVCVLGCSMIEFPVILLIRLTDILLTI